MKIREKTSYIDNMDEFKRKNMFGNISYLYKNDRKMRKKIIGRKLRNIKKDVQNLLWTPINRLENYIVRTN